MRLQYRTGDCRTGQESAEQDRVFQNRTGYCRTGQVTAGQERRLHDKQETAGKERRLTDRRLQDRTESWY